MTAFQGLPMRNQLLGGGVNFRTSLAENYYRKEPQSFAGTGYYTVVHVTLAEHDPVHSTDLLASSQRTLEGTSFCLDAVLNRCSSGVQ